MLTNISPIEIWMTIGVIFIVIEFSTIPGIGFLFLGLGALTTSSLIYFYSTIYDYQIATFGLTSIVWFLILWWPLKKLLYKKKADQSKHDYFNLIGNKVTVYKATIHPGKVGQVSWSGTIMNGTLSPLDNENANIGDELTVLEIKGNLLICSKK